MKDDTGDASRTPLPSTGGTEARGWLRGRRRPPHGETAFACRRGNPSSGELASAGGFPAVGDCEFPLGAGSF